jgi:3-hydroxyisobutyrate dehydrogenase-like beta-hydroxyacid dehydrogenase
MPERLRVAFLGLGLMGRPMAVNLARAGHPLAVWNRTATVAAELAASSSARCAATPADAVRDADVVISMLADGAALAAVYAGADGVLAALPPGAVAVDMGTSGPRAVRDLAAEVARAGGRFVDAPVSGSVGAARDATLTVMAGGDADAVALVSPVLRSVAARVHHVGPTGAGAALKLAINASLFALTEAVAELLVVAERSGIDPSVAYDVLLDSAVAAPAVRYRREAFLDPSVPTSFRLELAAKDLALFREHCSAVGAPTPLAGAVGVVVGDAVAAGFGGRDLAALVEWLRG